MDYTKQSFILYIAIGFGYIESEIHLIPVSDENFLNNEEITFNSLYHNGELIKYIVTEELSITDACKIDIARVIVFDINK